MRCRSSRSTRLLQGALCAAGLAGVAGCDLDCAGTEPPPGLAPGAALDGDAVALADAFGDAVAVPPEVTRATIESTLIATGFGVRYADGFVIVDDTKPQGIAFDAWDLDVIAVDMHQGMAISLETYAATWAALAGVDDVSAIRAARHEDLAVAAGSDAPAPRAYAQLLVALGRGHGYDLLAPDVDAAAAALDPLMMSLLSLRIGPELWQSVRAVDGSATQALDAAAPCTQTDTEGQVMDVAALASSTVWGKVLDRLGEGAFFRGADKFSAATQVANAALVYAKLAWTMAVFKVDMSVEPQPLERTTSTSTAGADATVTATFELDGTGKATLLNCFRIAMNAMNLDFNVPQDGPLGGKRVEWRIEAKGENDVIQSASGDILHKESSAAGVSSIVVQGKKQPHTLGGKLVDVQRRPVVRATTNLKHADFKQDMIDAAAGVGGLGALWSMPAELLNRMPLLFTGAVVVVVNDKKELLGDHFMIVGEYFDPNASGVALAKDAHDRIEAHVLVKIANNELTAEMLSWTDTSSSWTDTYDPSGAVGEGCDGTTTILGDSEIFTSRHKEIVQGFYVPPGTPGMPEAAYVAVSSFGYQTRRGYRIESDEPSCGTEEVLPDANETAMNIAFDSTMFQGVGTSITLGDETTGNGWIYTVTYVE